MGGLKLKIDCQIMLGDGISQYAERIRYRQIVTLAKYGLGEWTWNENGIEWDISGIVTHWMPLPELPRIEGE